MFVRLLLLAGWCAVALAQQGVTIEGRVVTTSGAPVRRAVVQARNLASANSGSITVISSATGTGSTSPVTSVETDGEGRFSIRGTSLGAVTVNVIRAGYETATQTVEVPAGQNSVNVTIALRRLGVIYGKVVDEYGDPFGRVNVMLYRRMYDGAWRWQQVNATNAGPDGTYSFGDLQVGRYYIGATDMTSPSVTSQATRYVQTFYPGATEPRGATAIEIAPETDLQGMEIRMQRGRVFRVRGKVADGTESLQSSVSLVPRDNSVPSPNRLAANISKDGTFTIERVPEGSYYALVQGQIRAAGNAPSVTVSGREPVTVSGRDVENVFLQLAPGVEITGRVRIEGTLPQPQKGPSPAPRVTLRPRDSNSGTGSSQSMPDGTFTLRNVAAGSYRVEASGPPGTYVASIRYGNEDVTWGYITIEKTGGAMEVVVKTDGARLNGVARGEKGEALGGTRVTVWSSANRGFSASAITDQTGAFIFQNLPPGEYRVAAWDSKVSSAPIFASLFGAMEFLHQFDTAAATVRLDPSGQQTQDVKMIPAAAMEDALGRLP